MGLISGFVPALCAAAALCCAHAPFAEAQSTVRQTARSSSKCNIVAAQDASSQSVEVVASVTAMTTAFVCEQNHTQADADILVQSRDIAVSAASAFARAVASVSVDCYLSGSASVQINGRSIAMSSAFSIAQAYVTAVATAEVCEGCESTAQVVASQTEELWLEAVAIAEVRVQTMTTIGMSRNIWIEEFVETVIDGVASAFAEVLANSYASKEDGCQAFIEASGGADANVLDDRAPSAFECVLNVSAADYTFAEDAVAEAVLSSTIYACEDPSDLRSNETARELASAVASVVAAVALQCSVNTSEHVSGTGVVCAYGSSQSIAVAEASAIAWAEGYVKALADCPTTLCVASAGSIADDIARIVVQAFAAVSANECAGANETFDVDIVRRATEVAAIEAIATVIISARVVWYGEECDAAADVTTHIVGAPTDRIPVRLPTTPNNASDAPILDVPTTVVSSNTSSLTENGTASLITSNEAPGVIVNGTTFEFSEVGAFVERCGEGSCITNYGQCSGQIRGEILPEPLPCCGRVFECVQQSSVYGLCLPKGSKLPPDWDGEVLAGYCGY
eukprot:jgi/Ulvmu1/12614/UM093_0006.1